MNEDSQKPKVKVVIIEDDLELREVLKVLLSRFATTFELDIKSFTSESGLEGLGQVIAIEPQIIIVDTTLPQYSGKELIDFLLSNPSIDSDSIIGIHDGSKEVIAKGYTLLEKKSKEFLQDISNEIFKRLIKHVTLSDEQIERKGVRKTLQGLRFVSLRGVIRWANNSDLAMHRIDGSKFFLVKWVNRLIWLFNQVVTSFYLIGINFLFSKVPDEHVEQAEKDAHQFRVKYTPTVASAIILLLFLIFQVLVAIVGGVTILNTEVTSIFSNIRL